MLPSTPTTMKNILTLSMKYHIPVFKKILPIILLIVVVKDLYIYFGGMPKNLLFEYVLVVIIIMLLIYFYVTSLYLTNHVIRRKPILLSDAFKKSMPLMLQTYLACFFYVVVFAALLYLGRFVVHLANLNAPKTQLTNGIIIICVFGLPFLFFMVLTFFAIPLIVIDKLLCWFGFKRSAQLVGIKNWSQSFVTYVFLMAIVLLVYPVTLHGYLLESYYLNAPFDFIVLSVLLPFFNNLIVYSLNDLKLQDDETKKKAA